jgi:hypothetical protein
VSAILLFDRLRIIFLSKDSGTWIPYKALAWLRRDPWPSFLLLSKAGHVARAWSGERCQSNFSSTPYMGNGAASQKDPSVAHCQDVAETFEKPAT